MESLSSEGLNRLLATLAQEGSGALSLPGVDEPVAPASYMRRALTVMRDRGMPFEQAWPAAINRIQVTEPDSAGMALVREDRSLLEESKPYWQARYERREPTSLERARCISGAWRRIGLS